MLDLMSLPAKTLENKVDYIRRPQTNTPPEPGMVQCISFPWCGNWIRPGEGYHKDYCTLECCEES
jgi:hypothetical protein